MKKSDAIILFNKLKAYYPDATCSLDFEEPFQLVVAVMLSAQCTDERVNKTTPELFKRCKTVQDFANIDINTYVTDINLDILGYIDPNITVNKIIDGKIVEKYHPKLPKELINIIKCKNPRCITSVEKDLIHICELTDEKKGIYRCKYCEEQVN